MHEHANRTSAITLIILLVVGFFLGDNSDALPLGGSDLAEAGLVFGIGFAVAEAAAIFEKSISDIRRRIAKNRRRLNRIATGAERRGRSLLQRIVEVLRHLF
jgi:hypothetical protein